MRLLLLLVLSAPVSAAQTTAAELLHYCYGAILPEKNVLEGGMCYGYLNGFIDGYAIGSFYSNENGRVYWCFPTRISKEQVARVYVKWAEQNPALLHKGADYMLSGALLDAFPCNKK